MQTIENLLGKMYIESTLMSKSHNMTNWLFFFLFNCYFFTALLNHVWCYRCYPITPRWWSLYGWWSCSSSQAYWNHLLCIWSCNTSTGYFWKQVIEWFQLRWYGHQPLESKQSVKCVKLYTGYRVQALVWGVFFVQVRIDCKGWSHCFFLFFF